MNNTSIWHLGKVHDISEEPRLSQKEKREQFVVMLSPLIVPMYEDER